MTEKAPVSIQLEIVGITLDVLMDDVFQTKVRQASYVLHEHSTHELYYMESGEMLFECNGSHTLTAGDLFVIAVGESHRVVQCSDDMRWFHFRFQIMSEYLRDMISSHLYHDYHQEIMQELIQKIRVYQSEEQSVMAQYRFRCHMGMLLSYVLESLAAAQAEQKSLYVVKEKPKSRIICYSQIDTFLYDNCKDDVQLKDLAEYLNYSKIQTARLVQEYCGMSFSQKLREIRIRLAKQLLIVGEMSVVEVAERCGYQTRQGFEAAFTQVEGISPSTFRKRKGLS